MVLDATTDTIELDLSANVATRQLEFYTSYNIVTSTSLTPAKQFGSSNNTTAVTILSAPSASQQHQLRFLSIYNCDTTSANVTIQLNNNGTLRTLISVTLMVGEYIHYTYAKGWQVFNHNGILKTINTAMNPSSTRAPAFFNAINTTTLLTLTNNTTYAVYLGTADRPYNQVTLAVSVSTQLAGAVTYCEAAIYKGYPTIGSNCTLTRCGFTDVSVGNNIGFNATGGKTIPVITTDIYAGDDLWAVFASSVATTAPVLRAGLADNIGAGMIQSTTSAQPSANSSISFTLQAATNIIWVTWQGFQR